MRPAYPDAEAIEELLEAARERIAGTGDIEAHAAYGQAAEELAPYSALLDLLVIGSRPVRSFPQFTRPIPRGRSAGFSPVRWHGWSSTLDASNPMFPEVTQCPI